MLENLGGAGGAGGGLQDMLGGLAGSAGAGGLLGALGGAVAQRPESNNASFGEVLNSAFDQTPQEAIEPSADQEAAAALMLRAMIQAAKSDGKLDDGEQEKLMGQLGGDIDDGEAAFLRTEMQRPVDVNALVADVPRGMGPQVYAMSLLAIDLDSQTEA
ncbi:MAG: tellurite resistance TerB family protein [Tateyamaria sp.]|uniref:tellurite resistance TerB family protein n=1 Tax=Tateyamaria sp. TaxID=1929288 RepID=UPI0032DD5F58